MSTASDDQPDRPAHAEQSAQAGLPGLPGRHRGSAGRAQWLTRLAGQDAASLPFAPPSLDAVRARDIIGADDRVRIIDTQAPPWCQVCHLVIENQRGQQITGTGWLGGPRTVYTAAHNLLEAVQHHAARRVVVIPGRLGQRAPHGQFEAAGFATHPQWRGAQPPGSDLGVVWLGQEVGRALGWMGFQALASAQLLGLTVRSGGYPDDRDLGTLIGTPLLCESQISQVQADLLGYALDTRPGQSGSPVFRPDAQQRAVVLGVHAYGSPAGNHAVRLTEAAVAQLLQWWR